MRILVMGSGGLGGYFGGLLARAGEDVVFVARGAHRDALVSQGLRVGSPDGDFMVRARVVAQPAEAGTVDLVLFVVKTYDEAGAVEAIRPAVGPATAVLCLQNGVETEDRLAAAFGRAAVLGGATYVSAAIEAPGVIRHSGRSGTIVFGELDGRITPRVTALDEVLRHAGIRTEVVADIMRVLWEKFVFICAVGGMTATTRVTLGEVWEQAESREMLRGLMEETAAVGRARGIPLDGVVARQMALVEHLVGGADYHARASLYHDLAAGKRMELDALCGAVVRMGRDAGVPTPFSLAVVAVLRPHERRAAAAR
jgi:2-dehydropantoate 2-reductase